MSEGGVLEHVDYNEQELRNIANLKELREKRGLRLADVARATGVADSALRKIEAGRYLPSPESYHKLAQFFRWEPITVEAKPGLALAEFRGDFVVGHVYSISKKPCDSSEKNPDLTGYDVKFLFRYEGKQGIHHMFRETHGDWVRTYADYQLIGKIVKEVEYGNP